MLLLVFINPIDRMFTLVIFPLTMGPKNYIVSCNVYQYYITFSITILKFISQKIEIEIIRIVRCWARAAAAHSMQEMAACPLYLNYHELAPVYYRLWHAVACHNYPKYLEDIKNSPLYQNSVGLHRDFPYN